jgi:hypothetical protein
MRALLKLASVMLLVASGSAAYARVWVVYYETGGTIAMVMRPADHDCPDHFRPVRLSTEFEDFKELEIRSFNSELFVPNESDRRLEKTQPKLTLTMNVVGCAFRQHFVPRTGEVLFSGDIGIGRIDGVRFDFSDQKRRFSQDLYITYVAYLNPRSDVYSDSSTEGEPSQAANAIGELRFRFEWEPTALLDPVQEGDQIQSGHANIRAYIFPELN